jgi:predicted GH43/DUF377 family glycosyl hydrolase
VPELKEVPFEQGPTFSVHQVAELMGCPDSRVVRWVTQGLLVASGGNARGNPRSIAPAELLRFVREHPSAYVAADISDSLLADEAKKHRRSALDVLHELLRPKVTPNGNATGVAAVRPPAPSSHPAVVPASGVSWDCPKCHARMIAVEDDDGPIWKCIACGTAQPRAAAAR